MATAETSAAVSPDSVDLVHEDDAGGSLLGLLEEVADAGGTDAHEHLDEIRAGDTEEGHAGLAGDRTGEQGLACPGRSVEEHPLGDPGTEGLELLRVFEKLLDLVQFLDRLVGPGNVLEGDLGGIGGLALGLGLAEAHDLASAALHAVHEENPEADEQREGEQVDQEAPTRAARALRVEADSLFLEAGLELDLRLARGVADLPLLA